MCRTTYALIGLDVRLALKVLERHSEGTVKIWPRPYGLGYLGDLVVLLGGEFHEQECRGIVESFYMTGEVLYVHFLTAEKPMHKAMELLKERYPNLEIKYFAWDAYNHFYESNDKCMQFFAGDYVVKSYVNGEANEFFSVTELEVLLWAKRITGVECKSVDEVERIKLKPREYIRITKCQYTELF